MNKITDFNGIIKYFCLKCNRFHNRYYYVKDKCLNRTIKLTAKLFEQHKESAVKLNETELWHLQFQTSFKNYSKKEHSKTYGSRKQ